MTKRNRPSRAAVNAAAASVAGETAKLAMRTHAIAAECLRTQVLIAQLLLEPNNEAIQQLADRCIDRLKHLGFVPTDPADKFERATQQGQPESKIRPLEQPEQRGSLIPTETKEDKSNEN